MKVSRVLQLIVWVVGLCLAQQVPPQSSPGSRERGGGQVPMPQLKVLSAGLVHLLQGLQESQGYVEKHVEQVTGELEGTERDVERLRELGVQAGRAHRRVRADLQFLRAQGDRLERATRDLQLELGATEAERRGLELRVSRVLERVKNAAEPISAADSLVDMSLLKVILETQSGRLADLALEVRNQDVMIDRNLQHIVDLEQQVSRSRGRRPPARSGGTF
ncbi:uncharacterized protein LOC134034091 isoform X1 [Osmerus eperlanus]|uniref:uncharacterized protein LOC134034091 isoform X1 n=1 Tax=Osmerus eperlanus TaxID=29151 RepID=UPI002E0D97D3